MKVRVPASIIGFSNPFLPWTREIQPRRTQASIVEPFQTIIYRLRTSHYLKTFCNLLIQCGCVSVWFRLNSYCFYLGHVILNLWLDWTQTVLYFFVFLCTRGLKIWSVTCLLCFHWIVMKSSHFWASLFIRYCSLVPYSQTEDSQTISDSIVCTIGFIIH